MHKLFPAVCLLVSAVMPAKAIEIPDSTFRYEVEATATVSSGEHTPFWMLSNRDGLSSLEKNYGYMRAGLFRDYKYDKRFSWQAGVDLAAGYNFQSAFRVHQLYAGVRWRSLELTLGQLVRHNGVVNHELSSGDMLLSNNARPIPQIYISMPRYEPVPWTRKWLKAKFYFSFGYMTDGSWTEKHAPEASTYVKNRLFHSKALFLRVADPESDQWSFEGGLEMAAQFGGKIHLWDPYSKKVTWHNASPSLKDIFKIVVPLSGGDNAVLGDQTNVLGNHTGQWSAAVSYAPRDTDWRFRLYYQHFFEDHSMLFFDHAWRDMLLGFEVKFPKNPVISEFLYEYLITKDQSGPVYWDKTPEIPEQVSCRDDYYNNYTGYHWEYWGMALGNPLLISPIYNADGSLRFMHSRIKAHHFGFKGSPHRDLDYRMLMSISRSWGTYLHPTPDVLHNFNFLLELDYHPHQLPGWSGRVGFAADGGKLLGRSFGAMLTISKTGWL